MTEHWTDKFTKAGEVIHCDNSGIILRADALKALPKMPKESIDLVMLDPGWGYNCTPIPRTWVGLKYPTMKDRDILLAMLLAEKRLKKNRHAYLWVTSPRLLEQARITMFFTTFTGMRYVSSHVWYKPEGLGLGHYFRIDCEYALLFIKGRRLGIRKDISNLSEGTLSGHSHKPTASIEAMLEVSTKPGEIVLDPFLHTGKIAVVAKSMGRRFVGIEIVPAFAESAKINVSQEILFTKGEK